MNMKKTIDIIFNVSIGILIIAVFILLYFKFFKKNENAFDIKNIDDIYVYSTDNQKINLSNIMKETKENYIIFLEVSGCPSCIHNGFLEAQGLKEAGEKSLIIVIYDWFNEWKNWTQNYEFSPIYMIKKETYFKHIFSPFLPVLVKFKNGKVKNYKYITY